MLPVIWTILLGSPSKMFISSSPNKENATRVSHRALHLKKSQRWIWHFTLYLATVRKCPKPASLLSSNGASLKALLGLSLEHQSYLYSRDLKVLQVSPSRDAAEFLLLVLPYLMSSVPVSGLCLACDCALTYS